MLHFISVLVHPIHGIIGDIITVLLCIPVTGLFLFTFLYPVYSAIRDWIGAAEQVPVIPERIGLESVPLGAPRDGGNYVYTGHGWERLNDEEADEVRRNLKYAPKGKLKGPEEPMTRIENSNGDYLELVDGMWHRRQGGIEKQYRAHDIRLEFDGDDEYERPDGEEAYQIAEDAEL